MSLDYDKRVDFRAFDVLSDAIQSATPLDIARAIKSCDEIANSDKGIGHTWNPETRLLFRGFANLLRLYKRKYGKREFASMAEMRRAEAQGARHE